MSKRRRSSQGRLGRNRKKQRIYTIAGSAPGRQFVTRTMGPLAQSESKYFDAFLEDKTISEAVNMTAREADPATLDTLCVPTAGSDINNRIGRQIAVYKIDIRGTLNYSLHQDAPDVLPPPVTRFILYIDQQTNGTQSQSEQLMEIEGTPVLNNVINAFQNKANFGRFRVLKDFTVNPGPAITFNDATGAAGTASGSMTFPQRKWRCKHKFRNPLHIRFNATDGGSVADIIDNSLHLIAIVGNGTGATTISYMARSYYKDA